MEPAGGLGRALKRQSMEGGRTGWRLLQDFERKLDEVTTKGQRPQTSLQSRVHRMDIPSITNPFVIEVESILLLKGL